MNPILARFQHEPALLGETSRAWFESCVTGAVNALARMDEPLMSDDSFWFSEEDYRSAYRPYRVKNGILQIPVKGVLLNAFPWALGQWATGYEYIEAAMKRGMDDSEVKGIALMIDSPGGMVAGNFDLVDAIYAMRGKKPIKAFASDAAYSAAYSIASAADSITVTRSGGVGSVGVVTMHVDMSKALDEAGYKITFIFAGKHKVDGNSYEPLPEGVRARIQERVDSLYSEFVGIVARNRGMEESAVRKTEAAVFNAREALAIGFADSIGRTEDEITAFVANVNSTEEDDEMAAENQAQITQEAHDAAVATARVEGEKSGAAAALTRINGIIGSDAGKARPKAALNAALKTSMSVEEATAFLAELPEEKAEASAPVAPAPAGVGAQVFDAAMDKTKNPAVGAGDGAVTEITHGQLASIYGLPGFKQPSKE